jgi:tetratricopeptide (TPR) repeat protein
MPHKSGNYRLAIFAALVVLLIYLPSLKNDFVTFDDNEYIFNNEHIQSFDAGFIKWAFTSFHAGNWHPLTWISHAFDYAIWGLNPLGHHLTSIILHSLSTFIVVVLIRKLIVHWAEKKKQHALSNRGMLMTAMGTALLFGLHPIHVESVVWISERKDVLCAFFFLLSLLAYIIYAGNERAGSGRHAFLNRYYLASLALFMLALMSKPMAVTLPFVMLISDWYPLRRIIPGGLMRVIVLEKIPFFILGIISSIITLAAQQKAQAVISLEAVPFSPRLLIAVKALIVYLWKMVFPIGLNPFYRYPGNVPFLSLEYLLPLVLASGITVLCLLRIKKEKIWLALWGYYCVTLFPVLGIVQVGSQAMADRYTYLPSIAPFLFVGICLARMTDKTYYSNRRISLYKASSYVLNFALIATLCFLTVHQILIWKNGMTLWSKVIYFYPEFAFAYNGRAAAKFRSGFTESALKDFTKAIELNRLPEESAKYFTNRAIAYLKLGKYGEAVEDYTEAIAFGPDDHSLYSERGKLYVTLKENDKALKDFSEAIRLSEKPLFSYHNNRAVVYSKLGLLGEAIADYTAAIKLNPQSAATHRNRGIAYTKLQHFDKAIQDLERARELEGMDGLVEMSK